MSAIDCLRLLSNWQTVRQRSFGRNLLRQHFEAWCQTDANGTLWLFNIAMDNDPFIDDFPIKTTIYGGFSMAMLNNQMVNVDYRSNMIQ